jgi:zinc resistance-associated protein
LRFQSLPSGEGEKKQKEESKMKKLVMVSALVVIVGLLASQALACWWDGNYGGHMMGWGSGRGYYSQSFLNDTATLRQELAAKQGEYNALMAQSSPDPKRASQLSQEIVGLQDQLQAKAQAQGYMGPRGYGNGPYGDGWACW